MLISRGLEISFGSRPNLRVRKEETDLHNQDDMDVCHDRRVLCGHVFGTHLRYRHCHCRPDRIVQGGDRHRQRPKQSEKSQVH